MKTWKGSYTVEGSVIVSIVIFVLGALIICSFYIHDRAYLQGVACEVTAVGSNFATDKERTEAMAKAAKKTEESDLLGSRNLSKNISAGKKECNVSWKASYPIPGFAVNYFSDGKLKIAAECRNEIHMPADTIRKIRGVGELLTGGDQ